MCQQCKEFFSAYYSLEYHVQKTGHTALFCDTQDCGKVCSRFDTFSRHRKSHEDDVPRFPCKYCKKYSGLKGFKRKDHLNQHLRGYHNMDVNKKGSVDYVKRFCTREGCPEYQPRSSSKEGSFKSTSDYSTHIRTVHDESDFPCTILGCDRVGGKGYLREIDLRKHMKKIHGIDRLEGDPE
ncbi:hypothetical protein K491DRAFT_614152 [Lophiostoma macrostomum CBS 122681]|uniref:C2H2-type domain-containing protein n=1 Tax=Lophiostoma macrostomum CBS 122681 TaxID=1314788 RepID=A0A6A6SNE8_9PLEO|nr:hypothetical protein K491DRAFT_614152 [Lophiostoma macrostomum CBS 122681]